MVSIDLLFMLFFPVNASSRGRWSCGTTNNTVSGRGEPGCALTHALTAPPIRSTSPGCAVEQGLRAWTDDEGQDVDRHRAPSCDDLRADAIFVVKDTSPAERGTHDELLAPADSMPRCTTSSLANPRRPSPSAIELRRRSRSVRLRVRCAPRPRPPRREPPGPCG